MSSEYSNIFKHPIRIFQSRFWHSLFSLILHNIFYLLFQKVSPYEPLHWTKTKAQISFGVTAKLISAFVFATRKVQSLFFLNPKFQVSSCLLWLYSPVCVIPGRNPNCWFSHAQAHILFLGCNMGILLFGFRTFKAGIDCL